MPIQYLPAYPATSDMGCAMWLRHFAAMLPSYASHYGLLEEEVAAVQSDSLEFISWLIHRVHRATQAIQQPCSVATTFQEEEAAEAAARWRLLESAASVVHTIRAHHRYSLFDGMKLRLHFSPFPQRPSVLLPPHVRIILYQASNRRLAIALRWTVHPPV